MTVIIKADAAQPVRPFALPAVSSVTEPVDTHENERSELLGQVARLRKQLEELEGSTKAATARAFDEGRKKGLDEAARDEQGRCATLEQGMGDALRAWNERLAELDGLAALLSRAALGKMFDDPAKLSTLVLPAVARQIEQIRRQAVVALRVSSADFPDQEALAALEALTPGSVQVLASPDVSEGECFFDLQLGQVEISPLSQWRGLEALLAEFAGLGERQ